MLTLAQYGVKLSRLTREDIELVRHWRNESDIADFMEYRGHISAEAQIKWFKSINNKFNYYFIVEFEGKKVGLINVKNYRPELAFAEGGIFIWDRDYRDSLVAVYSTLCLLNFIFFILKISTVSRARILRGNTRAIFYNKLIGYKLLPGQENVENQVYELTKDDFIIHAAKLNKAATSLNEEHATLGYSGTVCEENLDEINQLLIAKAV